MALTPKPSQRLQVGHFRLAHSAPAATVVTPDIWFDRSAGQRRPIRLKDLASHLQTDIVEAEERAHIRGGSSGEVRRVWSR